MNNPINPNMDNNSKEQYMKNNVNNILNYNNQAKYFNYFMIIITIKMDYILDKII